MRIIVLVLLLSACASSNDKPKFGKPVDAPWGWTNTYCLEHKNEAGCK